MNFEAAQSPAPSSTPINESAADLICAKVYCELGLIDQAEKEVGQILESQIDNLDALNLYAKIKHIKGELSQAIACWAQLHIQAPHNETARMFLISIMHLAQNPERAAGEFVAMGHFGSKLPPMFLMELEKSFRLFIARQYQQARLVCDELALRNKGKNDRAYKLAILAKAWISELINDFDTAVDVLEQLGTHTGMETDIDRVLALARVYEAQGTPDSLGKAAHICRYLIRSYAKMSAVIRLAAIYRRLGNEAESNIYEQQFYQAFCQRMFVPSLDELAYAAQQAYIPLRSLKEARTSPGDSPVALSQRGEAIKAYLEGEPRTTRSYFVEHHCEPIDLQYRMEMLLEEQEYTYAFELCQKQWKGTEVEPSLLIWFLEYGMENQPVALKTLLATENTGKLCQEDLEKKLHEDPRNADIAQALALIFSLTGDAPNEKKFRERAAAFRSAHQKTKASIGRSLAAAVYNFTGKKKGIIHELWAERISVDRGTGGDLPDSQILGNLTGESRNAIKNIFVAVREYTQAKFPHLCTDLQDYNYMFKVTKEDEASGGQSIGLPTALAILSVFIQRPIKQSLASSGIIIAESHRALAVRRVGDTAYKVKAAFNRNLTKLLLPAENRSELEQLSEVPRVISANLVSFAMTFDEAVAHCFGSDIWIQ